MVSPILLTIPVQFVMGLLIGLLMDDREKAIGPNEFGVATLVFVLVHLTGSFIDGSHIMSVQMIIALCIGWIAMWGGLMTGNLLRFELIRKVIRDHVRDEIQIRLMSFLRAAQAYGYSGEEQKYHIMNERLAQLQESFAEVITVWTKINKGNVSHMQDKMSILSELSHDYADLTKYIATIEATTENKNKLIEQWVNFSNELADRLWDTLRTMEVLLFNRLQQLSTLKIIRIM